MHTIASRDEGISRTSLLGEIIDLLYIGEASVAVKEFDFLCVFYWRLIVKVLLAFCESPVKLQFLRNGELQRVRRLEYIK